MGYIKGLRERSKMKRPEGKRNIQKLCEMYKHLKQYVMFCIMFSELLCSPPAVSNIEFNWLVNRSCPIIQFSCLEGYEYTDGSQSVVRQCDSNPSDHRGQWNETIVDCQSE